MDIGNHPVLIVDDDEAIRVAVADALTDCGYEVRTAAHGRDAIDLLNAGLVPCLIILDLWMPVMDGWQFLDRLNEDPELTSIPVQILTAADAIKRVGMGEVGLMRKPLQLEALLAVVGKFC